MAELIQLAKTEDVRLSKLFSTIAPDGSRNHRQDEAFEATKHFQFILYGGAAGGGKSWWLRWALIRVLLRMFLKYKIEGTNAGLFCEDYPTLKDRQISKLVTEVPAWLAEPPREYNDIGFALRLRPRFGGGALLLRNLDKPSKYDSVEFVAVGVDELTRNGPGPHVFNELRKRLRWPGIPDHINLPFLAGTNPGKKGHGWVKRFWIDPATQPIAECYPKELRKYAAQFKFIRALAKDNHWNPASYYEKLLSLPDKMRRQMAEGNWEDFEGQFFGEWRSELHTCAHFEIPKHWKKFRASDWGFAKPWCVLWFAVSPMGTIYIYREVYEIEHTPDMMMRKVSQLSEGEEYKYSLLDPACWDSSRGLAIADQCATAGISWTKADNDRMAGWMRLREYLKWTRDQRGILTHAPKLVAFKNCENLIRTMPIQVHDELKAEDLDSDGEDHAADTARYGIMSLPGLSEVPLDELPTDYAEADMRARERERKNNSSNYGDLS